MIPQGGIDCGVGEGVPQLVCDIPYQCEDFLSIKVFVINMWHTVPENYKKISSLLLLLALQD